MQQWKFTFSKFLWVDFSTANESEIIVVGAKNNMMWFSYCMAQIKNNVIKPQRKIGEISDVSEERQDDWSLLIDAPRVL